MIAADGDQRTHHTFPPTFISELTRACERRDGTPKRGEVEFTCPADGHEDRHPSARWNPAKGAWCCPVCRAGGGALDLADRLGIAKPDRRLADVYAATTRPAPRVNRRANVIYDYTSAAGSLLYQVERQQTADGDKKFVQFQLGPDGKRIYTLGDVRRVLFKLPEVRRAIDAGKPILFPEGEADVLRLVELGYTASTNAQGANGWRPEFADMLAGANVLLFPDHDQPGYHRVLGIYDAIAGVANSLKVVQIVGLPEKSDVSDFLDLYGDRAVTDITRIVSGTTTSTVDEDGVGLAVITRAALVQLASKTAPNGTTEEKIGRSEFPVGTVIEGEIPTPPPAAGRVDIGDGLAVYLSAQDQHTKEVTRQAWAAICAHNDPAIIFMYANSPTRLVVQIDGTPIPETLDERKLSHLVARAVIWYRTVPVPKTNPAEYEHRYAHPPPPIVKDMLEETGVGLPILSRITHSPAYGPDGSLSLDPGYDAPSESYYVANGLVVPPVPPRPTDQQIVDARDLINTEVFGDFPFIDDADRAHAFAMLLQAFVRSCISGTTPMYMINKPKAGTGATLLAQVVALIASGQPSVTMTQAKSDDEMRKRITSTLRRLPPQILLDNVRGTLDDASLASVLTARVWGDRILGESNNVEIPVNCTWVATGNNVGMSDEIARRSVPIRLDAQVERPDARADWRHDHIEDWVIEHRGELVGACLTLCQAWFAAGRPKPTNTVRLGGYEAWSGVMGGILEVAGQPGFLTNLRKFRERADVVTDITKAFLERWWSDRQSSTVTIKSLIPAATDVGIDLGKSDSERSMSTTLGMFVKRLEGQIYTIDNDQLVRVADAGKDGHTKAQLWMLEESILAEPAVPAEPFQVIRGRPSKGEGAAPRNTSMGTEQKGSAGTAGSANEEAF